MGVSKTCLAGDKFATGRLRTPEDSSRSRVLSRVKNAMLCHSYDLLFVQNKFFDLKFRKYGPIFPKFPKWKNFQCIGLS